jgi:hypothetical protein
MSENQTQLDRIRTIVDTLNRELMKIANSDPTLADQLDVRDEIMRLNHKTSDVSKFLGYVDKNLDQQGLDFELEEIFNIGLRKFKRVEKKSISKLNVEKLKELIPDQGHYDECFDIELKAKTQPNLVRVLAVMGYDIDIKQLYESQAKEGQFTIKEIN